MQASVLLIVHHWSICTRSEVVYGQISTTLLSGQALFKATGFSGVSEPDDRLDVDEGDILEALVVKPSGRLDELLDVDVAAARLALVSTELRDEGTVWLALTAPNVLW